MFFFFVCVCMCVLCACVCVCVWGDVCVVGGRNVHIHEVGVVVFVLGEGRGGKVYCSKNETEKYQFSH